MCVTLFFVLASVTLVLTNAQWNPLIVGHWPFDESVIQQSMNDWVAEVTPSPANCSCSPALSTLPCCGEASPVFGSGFLSLPPFSTINATLNIPRDLSNFSVATWVWLSTNSTQYTIIQYHANSINDNSWELSIINKTITFSYTNYSILQSTTFSSQSLAMLAVQAWQHVAVTYNNGMVNFFVNGRAIVPATVTINTQDFQFYGITYSIGNCYSSTCPYIDELWLLGVPVTGQEVIDLLETNQFHPPYLIAGWNYDNAFNPLYDRSGNQHHFRAFDLAVMNVTKGVIGSGAQIQELSVDLPNFMCHPTLMVPLSFTFTSFIKLTGQYNQPLFTVTNGTQVLFSLEIVPGNTSITLMTTVAESTIYIPYTDESWLHVAIVVDAVTDVVTLFTNGSSIWNDRFNLSLFCQSASNDYVTITLGGKRVDTRRRRLLDTGGTVVDQSNIYGTALLPPFIYYTMNGPRGSSNCYSDLSCASFYYPFDFNFTNIVSEERAHPQCHGRRSTNLLYDISPNSRYGAGSLQNRGTCDRYVDLNTGHWNIFRSNSPDFTISAWVLLPNTVTLPSFIFAEMDILTGQSQFLASYSNTSDGGPVLTFNASWVGSPASYSLASSAYNPNMWHQFAARFSWEQQSLDILWDGTLVMTGAIQSPADSFTASFAIGLTNVQQFTGLVDELWNYKLFLDDSSLYLLNQYNTIFPCWSLPNLLPPIAWIPLQGSFVDISNSTDNVTLSGVISGYNFVTNAGGEVVWYQSTHDNSQFGGLVLSDIVVPVVFTASIWTWLNGPSFASYCQTYVGHPGDAPSFGSLGPVGGFALQSCDGQLFFILYTFQPYDGYTVNGYTGYAVQNNVIGQTGAIVTEQWMHLVGTLDANGVCTLYCNGTAIATATLSSSILSSWQANAHSPVSIGFDGVDSSANSVFGYLQDFLMFDYALTASQVQELYSKGFNYAIGTCQEACLPGTYSSTGYASIGECLLCPQNTNTSLYAATQCESCPQGTATLTNGSLTCEYCPAGYWSLDGTITAVGGCQACGFGTYAGQAGSTLCLPCKNHTTTGYSVANIECQLCAPGAYSSDGTPSPFCYPCNLNTYSNQSGTINCTECGPNSAALSLGMQSCIDFCPPGTYSLDGTVAYNCTACPSGTYSDTYGTVEEHDGRDLQCKLCGTGFSTGGQTGSITCSPLCPPGTYSSDGTNRTGPCVQCGAGYVTNSFGSTSCYTCNLGTYSSQNSSHCLSCPVGSTSNGASSSCYCLPGYFTPAIGECYPCPSGTYSNSNNASSCTSCPIGNYTSIGQIAATSCDATCTHNFALYFDGTLAQQVDAVTTPAFGDYSANAPSVNSISHLAFTVSLRLNTDSDPFILPSRRMYLIAKDGVFRAILGTNGQIGFRLMSLMSDYVYTVNASIVRYGWIQFAATVSLQANWSTISLTTYICNITLYIDGQLNAVYSLPTWSLSGINTTTIDQMQVAMAANYSFTTLGGCTASIPYATLLALDPAWSVLNGSNYLTDCDFIDVILGVPNHLSYSTTPFNLTLYQTILNGVPQVNVSDMTAFSDYIISISNQLLTTFPWMTTASDPLHHGYFSGIMDDVMVFSSALDASAIQSFYLLPLITLDCSFISQSYEVCNALTQLILFVDFGEWVPTTDWTSATRIGYAQYHPNWPYWLAPQPIDFGPICYPESAAKPGMFAQEATVDTSFGVCAPGTFTPGGEYRCYVCPLGSFIDSFEASFCYLCPVNMSTTDIGATTCNVNTTFNPARIFYEVNNVNGSMHRRRLLQNPFAAIGLGLRHRINRLIGPSRARGGEIEMRPVRTQPPQSPSQTQTSVSQTQTETPQNNLEEVEYRIGQFPTGLARYKSAIEAAFGIAALVIADVVLAFCISRPTDCGFPGDSDGESPTQNKYCPSGLNPLPTSNSSVCCSIGSGFIQGVGCQLCAKGWYNDEEYWNIPCKVAQSGWYSTLSDGVASGDQTGATGQRPALPGTYVSNTVGGSPVGYGASFNLQCPPGNYSSNPHPIGNVDCPTCQVGTSNPSWGQSICLECPLGSYQNMMGQTQCIACPVNSWQNVLGQTSCISCLSGYYTITNGSSTPTSCIQTLLDLCENQRFASVERQQLCPNLTAGTVIIPTIYDLAQFEGHRDLAGEYIMITNEIRERLRVNLMVDSNNVDNRRTTSNQNWRVPAITGFLLRFRIIDVQSDNSRVVQNFGMILNRQPATNDQATNNQPTSSSSRQRSRQSTSQPTSQSLTGFHLYPIRIFLITDRGSQDLFTATQNARFTYSDIAGSITVHVPRPFDSSLAERLQNNNQANTLQIIGLLLIEPLRFSTFADRVRDAIQSEFQNIVFEQDNVDEARDYDNAANAQVRLLRNEQLASNQMRLRPWNVALLSDTAMRTYSSTIQSSADRLLLPGGISQITNVYGIDVDNFCIPGYNFSGSAIVIADFNGDQRADILMQSMTTFQNIQTWCSNGASAIHMSTSTVDFSFSMVCQIPLFEPNLVNVIPILANADNTVDVLKQVNTSYVSSDCGIGQSAVYLSRANGTFGGANCLSFDLNKDMITVTPIDVDGDLLTDLILQLNPETYSISDCVASSGALYMSNGIGNFQFSSCLPFNVDRDSVKLTAMDINSDGYVDIIMQAGNTNNTDCAFGRFGQGGVYLSNGDTTFRPIVCFNFSVHKDFVNLLFAQINNDTYQDMILQVSSSYVNMFNNLCSGTISSQTGIVMLSQGNGSFYSYPSSCLRINLDLDSVEATLMDINGDTYADLITKSSSNASTSVQCIGGVGVFLFYNGSYRSSAECISGISGEDTMLLANFDGDAMVDFMVLDNSNYEYCESNGVTLYRPGTYFWSNRSTWVL